MYIWTRLKALIIVKLYLQTPALFTKVLFQLLLMWFVWCMCIWVSCILWSQVGGAKKLLRNISIKIWICLSKRDKCFTVPISWGYLGVWGFFLGGGSEDLIAVVLNNGNYCIFCRLTAVFCIWSQECRSFCEDKKWKHSWFPRALLSLNVIYIGQNSWMYPLLMWWLHAKFNDEFLYVSCVDSTGNVAAVFMAVL